MRHRLGALDLAADMPLAPGITALFGPSGQAKPACCAAVAGLLRPDEGQIEIGAETWFDSAKGINLPPHQRRVGYVFQEPRLSPISRSRQNLRFGAPRGAHMDDLVALLGLGPLWNVGLPAFLAVRLSGWRSVVRFWLRRKFC